LGHHNYTVVELTNRPGAANVLFHK
jgi:hypothetical protein